MLKFDYAEYAASEKATLESRQAAEAAAKNICERGCANLFLAGVGGSLSPMMALGEMAKQLTDLPVYVEQAAELLARGHRHLGPGSVVVTMSKSGDTKETVAIAKACRQQKIPVVALTGDRESPLGAEAEYHIPMRHTNGVEYEYMLLYWLFFGLLHARGEFPQYPDFAQRLTLLPRKLLTAKEAFEEQADAIAEAYYQEPYMLWVGGGEMWGETYLFSMCILEEMQWKRTKAVTSAELFHGTLELVEKDTCVFLIKGAGACRQLDERAQRFLEQHTNKLTVIDPAPYMEEQEPFGWLLAPLYVSTLLVDRLAVHMEKYTGHDLDFRRYYRQFEY
ncbi:MAG: SIS domain-containing protein [Lachnospiraceae bacterium]|nr:SIS domain-containing protein [Lachnospiraceae bacterium]